jgi:transposase
MPNAMEDEIESRKDAFKAARERYGFNEYALHRYVTGICHSWLGAHIDANTSQKIATRTYNAVDRAGKDDHVKFKWYGQMDSLEGKTNKQGIRWKDGKVVWNGLELRVITDFSDPVIAHGLSCPVKYVRIVRKEIRGKIRYYVQLVCEGLPYQKERNIVTKEKVGLDLGPSTVAVVSDNSASLDLFCRELDNAQAEIHKLQRRMDRQRRANNPGNYDPDGTINKGKKKWKDSRRYIQTRAALRELHRRQATHRKSLHGKMINDILRQGNSVFLEKISYKAWQKMFGKSISYRGPGMFISGLKRKAVSGNGDVTEFPTYPALSQICICDRKKKKKLSERWYRCECGLVAQRDLFSAFLARHIMYSDKWICDTEAAKIEWPSMKDIFGRAVGIARRLYPDKSPSSFGL